MGTSQFNAVPTDMSFQPGKLALLIIDMQRDFLEEGGLGHLRGGDIRLLRKIIPRLISLREACNHAGIPVIFTREGYSKDLSDCPASHISRQPEGQRIGDSGRLGRLLIRGEVGHEIIPELTSLWCSKTADETVIDKSSKDCFLTTDLQSTLLQKGIHQVMVTGVTTNVCVGATVRSGCDRGFDMLAIGDCCAAYDKSLHDAELRAITAHGGIFGWTAKTVDVIPRIWELESR